MIHSQNSSFPFMCPHSPLLLFSSSHDCYAYWSGYSFLQPPSIEPGWDLCKEQALNIFCCKLFLFYLLKQWKYNFTFLSDEIATLALFELNLFWKIYKSLIYIYSKIFKKLDLLSWTTVRSLVDMCLHSARQLIWETVWLPVLVVQASQIHVPWSHPFPGNFLLVLLLLFLYELILCLIMTE